jgi:putative ABC transport system permease protein
VFLALKEMRRSAVRFGLLVASIGLLVFLILFQQTLQSGLITSFIGAIRNQSAPVLVYSVDGLRNLQGSVITPGLHEAIQSVPGVGHTGRIGQGTFSVTAGRKLTSTAIIGYDDEHLGAPTTLVSGRLPRVGGEAVALASAARNGFALGDTVTVQPGGLALKIVGQAAQIGFQASPTVFTTYPTFEQAVRAANPDARTPLPAAIAVSPAPGVTDAELVARIHDAVPGADALTRSQAVASTPGVDQVQQSFRIIFLLFGLVIPLVTGLFFLIVTLQKASALTLLRAVGAPSSALVRSLLFQVALVLLAGIGVGIALYAPLASQTIGSIPLSFQSGAVAFWSVLLFVLGLLSALVAVRRVLQIDPIEATTGAGLGR